MTDPRDTVGEATRRAVLGDAHVDRSIAGSTECGRPLVEYPGGVRVAERTLVEIGSLPEPPGPRPAATG